MSNEILGWGLVATLVLSGLSGVFEVSDDVYTILGIPLLVFGIWGGIRLLKNK